MDTLLEVLALHLSNDDVWKGQVGQQAWEIQQMCTKFYPKYDGNLLTSWTTTTLSSKNLLFVSASY